MKPLLIRCDGDAQMGTGHVMRCLALAQAWRDDGGRVALVAAVLAPPLQERLGVEGVEVSAVKADPGSAQDALATVALAHRLDADWMVVDGYQFGSEYQRVLKSGGRRVLVVDDYGHAGHYWADLVLNQNLHAREEFYGNREAHTGLLLGTEYVLLRREFRRWQGWKREIPSSARRLLVTLGGSDPANITLKVVEAVRQMNLEEMEVAVVVGGGNPHRQSLQAAVGAFPNRIRLESNVSDMPALMAWADVAVASAGTTVWELAFMGLPSLLVVLAENQRETAAALGRAGVAVNPGPFAHAWHDKFGEHLRSLMLDPERRAGMSGRAAALVDGKGSERVLRRMQAPVVCLRAVRQEDCLLAWEWANDPDVRRVSFTPDPIPMERHMQWFKSMIDDPNCVWYMGVGEDGSPIGHVRYEIKNGEAVVSTTLSREFRGRGYGSTLIQLSSWNVVRSHGVKQIHAFVKRENISSLRAFEKAGYHQKEMANIGEAEAIRLTFCGYGSS